MIVLIFGCWVSGNDSIVFMFVFLLEVVLFLMLVVVVIWIGVWWIFEMGRMGFIVFFVVFVE